MLCTGMKVHDEIARVIGVLAPMILIFNRLSRVINIMASLYGQMDEDYPINQS